MGLLGDIGGIIVGGLLGGPAGALVVFTAQHGDEVFEGTIDVARQIVQIGEDVYRAIPPEAFALAVSPLHGLLKHVAEDEIIMLGDIAGEAIIMSALSWPALGPVGATLQIAEGAVPLYITAGSLLGKFHHRLLNDEEWEMARYIFRDSLFERDQIILTNVGGLGGAAFVYPTTLGSIYVNLGHSYVHNGTTPDGPLLFHELTHVWQAKQRVLKEIFFCDTIPDALARRYDFTTTPTNQWSEYGTEQQASIVEAWTRGATGRRNLQFTGTRNKLAIGSPLFRYINGNIRRSNNATRTEDGRSVRQLLTEGRHRNMKNMHPKPPKYRGIVE